ncbi:MAG: FHA domain-containing protein [Azoarcus sp.]|nr:FHA domain-containing protein [Azoarcus sp.]
MIATSNLRNLCVLIAEIVGGNRLAARLGEAETDRAVERCLNRVDLAIGGSGGEIIIRDSTAVIATFGQCDDAVMAACEALDRVHKLPPVSGMQMRLRIGLHYGEVADRRGDGLEGARQIILTCAAGQALASAAVVAELSPAVRHFASAEAFDNEAQKHLPWSVFTIGNPVAGPLTSATSLRPLPNVDALSQKEVSPGAQIPRPPSEISTAAGSGSGPSLNQRLRLRRQDEMMFVEENRPIVLIGRELANDIVIIDPRASRQHARIERRRAGYILIDQSTNGCFVAIDGQEECFIKDAEFLLSGRGSIGCGFSPRETQEDIVFFEIV